MFFFLTLLILSNPIVGEKVKKSSVAVKSTTDSTPISVISKPKKNISQKDPTVKKVLLVSKKSSDSSLKSKNPESSTSNSQKDSVKKPNKKSKPKKTTIKRLFPWIEGKKLGVGFEVRENVIPKFFLGLFLKGSHPIVSPSYSLRFIIRAKKVDIIIKGSYWNVDPKDGVYLSGTYDWGLADYVNFKKFKFYWAQLSLLWKKKISDGFYFTYGGGVGVGYLDTELYTTPAQGCTPSNYENVSTSTRYLGSKYCYRDTYKEFWTSQSVPKGMAIFEGTVGLRYDVSKDVTLKFETGLLLPGFLHTTLAVEYIF
jgi:hypothetical protein